MVHKIKKTKFSLSNFAGNKIAKLNPEKNKRRFQERTTAKKFSLSLIVMLNIFLLINLVVAQSYIIHQTDNLNEDSEVFGIKENNSIINFVMKLLREFFKINQIGIVSAGIFDLENETAMNITGSFDATYSLSDVSWNCCLKMKDGSICQDISSTTPELCAVNPVPTKCEQLSSCKIGCCIDEEEGLCTTKSPMQKCESDGGKWDENANCLIQECQKGCCVLGGNVQFVTETRCGRLSLTNGFEKDFRDLTTETECLALSASQFRGACIFQGESCSIKTEAECLSNNGDFYQNYLCSNPNLGTNCERQISANCIEGEDEIYWFDSCGNQENIYSSDKDASWNNGMLLKKEDSCNSDSANINSKDCGNCNYFLGSKCSETSSTETHIENGNFVCTSMKCIDEKGDVRENGESWCVYDGYIGDGKDTVGSRHWKRYCIEGEIKTEPCADYRGAVCAQSVIEEAGKTFSIASCVANEASLCLGYNSDKETMEKNCNENKYCMIKNINVDSYFKFDICVGRYPRGFDLRDSSGANDGICSMASQTCTVFYMKDWKGHWYCVENCACETGAFSTQMNDLCVSLGDCGSSVNYIGEGTDNIKVSGAPSVSWKDYKKYSKPVGGQFAEPQDIDKFLSSIVGTSMDLPEQEQSGLEKGVKMLGTVSGGLGVVAWGAMALTGQTLLYGAGGLGGFYFNSAQISASALKSGGITNVGGAFMGATACAAIGMYAGSYLAGYLEISGNAAVVMALAGGVVGATAYLTYIEFATWCPYALVIAVIIMIYIAIIGWGKTKEVKVEFTCMPWQSPVGGDDCEKCNDNPLKPCTKYRCSSLGQACKLLNENTENPICQSIKYETNPPAISPEEVLTDGYEFFNEQTKRVEIRAIDGDCIPEFTPVLFSLKTDEFAQCKYEFARTSDYKEMTNYPLEQNSFRLNHTFAFSMPSIDSLSVYNVTGDLKEMFGNMNMYVRCQDYHGNFNIDEYAVNFCINSGPDLTAAYITKSIPKDGSYLKYGTNETDLIIYLNEPAECKYDVVENKNYDEMTNSMQCETGLMDAKSYGWACSTILTNLTDTNNYYIKCEDKPWVQTPEDIIKYQERNINSDDFAYTFYITERELEIILTFPKGEIEQGFAPASVDLEVETSGGMDNGKSACYYEWAGNWVQFFDTFSSSHKQKGLNLMGGNFNIPIKCEDEAGNIDYGNISFSLNIDSSAPIVIRAYKSGSDLRLITDEKAECYYDFNRCNFNMDDATSMTTALSANHYANWIAGKTYYIKCKDIWGNTNPDCAIKIRPSSLY